MNFNRPLDLEPAPAADETAVPASQTHQPAKRRWRGRLVAGGLAFALAGSLAAGAWAKHAQHREVALATEQRLDFVPQVRVAIVQPILGNDTPILEYEPGTWGPPEAAALTQSVGGWSCPPG